MAYDLVTITTSPAAVSAGGSGFYQNLGDGRGYTPLDLWINESPSTFADGTFESYAVGAGVPRGWEGLTGAPSAEGATYSIVADGVNGSKAARLSVGSSTVRSARLIQSTTTPVSPGQTVRFTVAAKTTDTARGRLRFDIIGNSGNDRVASSSGFYTMTTSFQTFEYNWVVPTGVTAYRAGVFFGGEGGEVAVNSSMTVDNFNPLVVPASNLPSQPTNVNYSVPSNSSATLTWAPPVSTGGSPITGYFVQRDGFDTGGYGTWSTTVGADQRSVTFLSLRTGDTYNLEVAAVTANGRGPSVVKTVVVGSAPVQTTNWALFPYSSSSIWKLGRSESATFEASGGPKTTSLLNNGAEGSGQIWVNSYEWSHNMVYSTVNDPMKTMTDRNDGSRTRTYRIPMDAVPSVGEDAHLHVLDPDGYTLHEAFAVQITNAGTPEATYTAGRVATSDLRSSGIGPQAGTRAYGGGAMAGLIRRHEVDAADPAFVADPRYPGQNVPLVKHPLAFALRSDQLYAPVHADQTYGYFTDDLPLDITRYPGWPSGQIRRGFMKQFGYVWPATEQDWSSIEPTYGYKGVIPMGSYFSIPTGVARPALANIEALTYEEKCMLTIFHSLQDYGAYVTDRSNAMALYVEHTPGNAGPAETFAHTVRGGDSYSVRPLRTALALCRVVTNNDHANPNGGPAGSTRRGS